VFPLAAQRRRDERLERQWLSEADVVVGVSRAAVADLRERLGIEAELIPNGWDPQEVHADSEASPDVELDPKRVSLVYTGRFGSYGRDPRPLVEALERLAAADPGTASRLELVVAGPLTEQEELLFAREVSPARVAVVGSLPRERALALQREADCLLLLAQPTRSQLLNFKLFEYLASGSPILALAAGTEAGRVVEEIGGVAVRADDPAAIAKSLADLVANPPSPPPREALAPYTYPAPAERMAAAVEQAIARARD
jgi:glycosyltransferase involved in cell wall biosynthesis